jgi:hypothetical protein
MNRLKPLHYAIIAIAAFGSFTAYRALRTPAASQLLDFKQGEMPPCDSAFSRRLLIQTIHQSPVAMQSGLKVLQLGSVIDYLNDNNRPVDPKSLDPKEDLRFCKANVFTNAGQGDVHFVLKWTDAKKDTVWLQVTVSTL